MAEYPFTITVIEAKVHSESVGPFVKIQIAQLPAFEVIKSYKITWGDGDPESSLDYLSWPRLDKNLGWPEGRWELSRRKDEDLARYPSKKRGETHAGFSVAGTNFPHQYTLENQNKKFIIQVTGWTQVDFTGESFTESVPVDFAGCKNSLENISIVCNPVTEMSTAGYRSARRAINTVAPPGSSASPLEVFGGKFEFSLVGLPAFAIADVKWAFVGVNDPTADVETLAHRLRDPAMRTLLDWHYLIADDPDRLSGLRGVQYYRVTEAKENPQLSVNYSWGAINVASDKQVEFLCAKATVFVQCKRQSKGRRSLRERQKDFISKTIAVCCKNPQFVSQSSPCFSDKLIETFKLVSEEYQKVADLLASFRPVETPASFSERSIRQIATVNESRLNSLESSFLSADAAGKAATSNEEFTEMLSGKGDPDRLSRERHGRKLDPRTELLTACLFEARKLRDTVSSTRTALLNDLREAREALAKANIEQA